MRSKRICHFEGVSSEPAARDAFRSECYPNAFVALKASRVNPAARWVRGQLEMLSVLNAISNILGHALAQVHGPKNLAMRL